MIFSENTYLEGFHTLLFMWQENILGVRTV